MPNLCCLLLSRYLNDPSAPNRLGLYLSSIRPDHFERHSVPVLQFRENFSDSEIQHEFFILLENAFHLLTPEQQEMVLGIILNGPPCI